MATAARRFPGALRREAEKLRELDASPEQKRYMLAKAAYGAAKASVDTEVARIQVPRPTRDEIRANVKALHETGELPIHPWYAARGVIEDSYKLHKRWREELDAGAALIVWGAENAKRGVGAERYAQIAVAFERGPGLSGAMREKLLDICVRMEVSQ